ncbi:hypothetical protein DM01DRAFT_1334416 [Hesseltinella vesiculosa]|uniref:CUE domain-containing protein n=1 Tax=Hesseltinella vesiculosa TaxID=101127 RepID=A0A1X2GM29_9FUNG|nr:hypothetical protein DM01DRAFT_1334416 [Hesseltinella vesiculosa]
MPETADDQEDNVEADEDPAVKTLRDAFPDLDVDIIKAILATHDGNVELSFEALLAMSDPDYQTTPGANDDLLAKSQQEKDDELLARQLAQEYDQQLRQQDQQRHQDSGPAFNFQEELPVIKERVIEAGAGKWVRKIKAMMYLWLHQGS